MSDLDAIAPSPIRSTGPSGPHGIGRDRAAATLERVLWMATEAIPLFAANPELASDLTCLMKPVGEAALLLYAAASALPHHSRLSEPFARLQEQVAAVARSERMRTAIRFRPAAADEFALAHLCLERLGDRDAATARALAEAQASPIHAMRERTPWKVVEAWWLRDTADPAAAAPPLEGTLLAAGIDLFGAARGDLYAFTHALIYAADFGRRRPALPRSAQAIAADADAALAGVIDRDDFDLAAELLLTWPYLGLPWSPGAAFSLGVLFDIESEVGYLPALSIRKSSYEAEPPDRRRLWFLKEAYHTEFVMGMLAAAVAARDDHGQAFCLPADEFAYRARCDALLAACVHAPCWMAPTIASPAPLTFAISAAIQRHARSLDLEALREALLLGVEAGMEGDPAVWQGLDMLDRLVGCAEPS